MLGRRVEPSLGATDFAASRPGWRNPGGAPRPASRGSTPDWSTHRPGPSWEGKAARMAALLLLIAGVPGLVFAWVWLFPSRRATPMLVVSLASYDAPVPPNDFAVDDADRFKAAFGDYDNIDLTVAVEPRTSADLLKQLDDFLASAKPGGPKSNVVLVYLSAL